MKSWQYEIDDVLLIWRKGQQVPAKIVGFIDQLDDTTPLLCLLRVSDGQRWGGRQLRIYSCDIIEPLPHWEEERQAAWEAELKAHADAIWAGMSEAERARVHRQAMRMGLVRERRSPLDILIDRAVGLE